MRRVVGYDMARAAADQVYEAAGVGPEDIRVVELHDCFTTNELLTYEALRPDPRGHRREVHRSTATTPTAAGSSPTRPAACCPRATRSAPPASRSAPSWSGSCAATAGPRQVEGAQARAAAQPRPRRRRASSPSTRRSADAAIDPTRDRHRARRRSASTSSAAGCAFFAAAIGETDPVYTDLDAARAAGHRDLPVPPTFLFASSWSGPTRSAGSTRPRRRPARASCTASRRSTYHAHGVRRRRG